MTYETITLDVADNIATITLNRPERMNACSLEMAGEINDAISNELSDARCLVITGAGRGFCSGADLSARGDRSVARGEGSYIALTRHYNPLMMNLARLNMPIITAINGAAAGVGCSIGLCGDFVIAGKSGYFLQAFVNIGLVPDGGASWMLPRLVGKARATEMMLLGEKISGEKAADWGMIYKCVEDEALQAETRALATRLANGPTVVARWSGSPRTACERRSMSASDAASNAASGTRMRRIAVHFCPAFWVMSRATSDTNI